MVATEVVLRVIMVEVEVAVVLEATLLQVVTEEVQTTQVDRQPEVVVVAEVEVYLIHSTDKVAQGVAVAALEYLEPAPMVQDQ
jgi:hypothetical protein